MTPDEIANKYHGVLQRACELVRADSHLAFGDAVDRAAAEFPEPIPQDVLDMITNGVFTIIVNDLDRRWPKRTDRLH